MAPGTPKHAAAAHCNKQANCSPPSQLCAAIQLLAVQNPFPPQAHMHDQRKQAWRVQNQVRRPHTVRAAAPRAQTHPHLAPTCPALLEQRTDPARRCVLHPRRLLGTLGTPPKPWPLRKEHNPVLEVGPLQATAAARTPTHKHQAKPQLYPRVVRHCHGEHDTPLGCTQNPRTGKCRKGKPSMPAQQALPHANGNTVQPSA